jgi:hypothetical protein
VGGGAHTYANLAGAVSCGDPGEMMMPIGSCVDPAVRFAFIYRELAVRDVRPLAAGPAARTVRRNGPRDALDRIVGRTRISSSNAATAWRR